MSYKRERRGKLRKVKARSVGDMICSRTIRTATGEFYWFECSRDDFSQPPPTHPVPISEVIPPDAVLHGPFLTQTEADEDQRLVLLGPQCLVQEGGDWNPAWDKLQ
jgi:hypothetical protein